MRPSSAFRPCGVVQSTRLPLMREITGAKPVRDTIVSALKALSAMHSLGKRISPVQLRVRDPFLAVRKDRSRASAQVGFISPPCPGRHRRLRPLLRLGWRSLVITAQAYVGEVLRPPCVLRVSFCAGCKVSIALRAIVRSREFRANPTLAPVASRTREIPVRQRSDCR